MIGSIVGQNARRNSREKEPAQARGGGDRSTTGVGRRARTRITDAILSAIPAVDQKERPLPKQGMIANTTSKESGLAAARAVGQQLRAKSKRARLKGAPLLSRRSRIGPVVHVEPQPTADARRRTPPQSAAHNGIRAARHSPGARRGLIVNPGQARARPATGGADRSASAGGFGRA